MGQCEVMCGPRREALLTAAQATYNTVATVVLAVPVRRVASNYHTESMVAELAHVFHVDAKVHHPDALRIGLGYMHLSIYQCVPSCIHVCIHVSMYISYVCCHSSYFYFQACVQQCGCHM